ncbi:MAG: hypothetical protein ACTSO8_02710 [Promethearchaeota archaeon]
MEEFLKNMQLSDRAIKLYLQCIGQEPLSSFELYSILPNISQEEFSNIIKELIDAGLLVPIKLQTEDLFLQYLALPPITPILNYYGNINANLDNIKNQLQTLISNSLTNIFQEHKIVELDSMFKATQELRKDIEEDVIIQKQDIDDIVKGMEVLKVVKKILESFHQSIKGVTQTQFSHLINLISNIKKDINKKIESLELKKNEKAVKDVIEEVFKENFNKFLGDFTANLHKQIDEEFNNTIEALNNIVDSTFQFRNDFQMILLNMLNSYEKQINTIIELIKTKRDSLEVDLTNFENVISEDFKEIIYHSVDSVTALNNPINKALESYLNSVATSDESEQDDFWRIRSVSRVNEEIMHAISQSKEKLMIIVPKLEDHLAIDDFKNVSKSLKMDIASSEAHTNSHVKLMKELKNLEYRVLKNDNVIICKSDDNRFLIGIIKEDSQNPLLDFIGFATSNKALIKLFLFVVNAVWDTASSSLHETPRSLSVTTSKKSKAVKTTKPITSTRFKTPKTTATTPLTEQLTSPKTKTSGDGKTDEKISNLTKKLQSKFEKPPKKVSTKPTPKKTEESIKASEDASILIRTAFKTLIQKLHKLNGEEFSEEMENIAELILEKKGFSVTLHKIRSKINQYKNHLGHLNEVDISHIVESIEEWEKRLL